MRLQHDVSIKTISVGHWQVGGRIRLELRIGDGCCCGGEEGQCLVNSFAGFVFRGSRGELRAKIQVSTTCEYLPAKSKRN